MARATKAAPTKQPGTEIVDWEKQMAEQAEIAAAAQRATGGGGKFISLKAGQMAFDGQAMPGNQMAVVILAHVLENSYFDGPYDPDTPASPKCFAFGLHEDAMEPHSAVDNDDYFERQHDVCNGCPQNEWGSAPTGRGKACKNVVRLCMIPAGQYKPKGSGRNAGLELEMFDDEEHFAKTEPAFLKVPVMSVKNWTNFVRSLSSELHRPPHGVFTNIAVVPDPKSQFKLEFEVLDKVGNDLLPVIMNRHKAEQAGIDFPYVPPQEKEEEKVPAKASNKLTQRKKK